MELGIALDGVGHLGRLGAVSAVARAADQLGYGSVWCIGPWSASLAGAIAAVTEHVRIGLQRGDDSEALRALVGGRLRVGELAVWATPVQTGSDRPLCLDTSVSRLEIARRHLIEARAHVVAEVVVRLGGDPSVDEALAAYAYLGAVIEGCGGAP